MRRASLILAMAALVCGGATGTLRAQLGVGGSLTAGVALAHFGGDFSAVTQPLVDSAESAIAVANEWGFLFERIFADSTTSLQFVSDGALRQSVTGGFRQGNYSPREHRFTLRTIYTELLGPGTLAVGATLDTRGIADLPPMPVYLAPGYRSYSVDAGYSRPVNANTHVDGRIRLDDRDYAGPSVLPSLDFLDRRTFEVQAGSTRAFASELGNSSVRLFTAYQHHRYPSQARRDHAFRVGGQWALDRSQSWGLQFTLNADGTLNRSNSSRVEYNAARIEATAQQWLGADYIALLKVIWSGKSQVSPQEFLVPGEEADNQATFSGEITRILGPDMSLSLGAEWTRAETNVSGDYYRQARVSFALTKYLRF